MTEKITIRGYRVERTNGELKMLLDAGLVIVPRVPTPEMWEAGRAVQKRTLANVSDIYAAMIDAAVPPFRKD